MDASPAYSRAPKLSSPIGGPLEFAANLSPLAGERKHSSGPTPAELRRQDHHVPNLCSPHSRPKDHEDERLRKRRVQFCLAVSCLLRLEPRRALRPLATRSPVALASNEARGMILSLSARMWVHPVNRYKPQQLPRSSNSPPHPFGLVPSCIQSNPNLASNSFVTSASRFLVFKHLVLVQSSPVQKS